MNHLAQQRLDAADRTALVARTDDAVGELSPTLVADLPSGAIARLDVPPDVGRPAVVGSVFRVQIQESSARPLRSPTLGLAPQLPGVAARARSGAALVRSCASRTGPAPGRCRRGAWVGKHALARAVHVAESAGSGTCGCSTPASAALDPDERSSTSRTW